MIQGFVWELVFYLTVFQPMLFAIDLEEENEERTPVKKIRAVNLDDEPVIPAERVNYEPRRNINCEAFTEYALNCTMNAAVMYNSNKKSPPMPSNMENWCKAVKYLTNCASEWNIDCRDMTDSHFNEESINGHSYVVHHICEDKQFLEQYSDLGNCIDGTADQWEGCYVKFKTIIDGFKKNTTAEWTHYETHFYLCCGRASFRRCILDVVFSRPDVCSKNQALVLQKFSVVVSEGDVYQDCDFNMMYENCPGGDPRPNPNSNKLAQIIDLNDYASYMSASDVLIPVLYITSFWTFFVLCDTLF